MNPTEDAIIAVKFGKVWRWHINPSTRRFHGKTDWDAGPVSDWCEVDSEDLLNRARRMVATTYVPSTKHDKTGRFERLEAAHEAAHATGLCRRPSGHWGR